jgi:hypothetical protein
MNRDNNSVQKPLSQQPLADDLISRHTPVMQQYLLA